MTGEGVLAPVVREVAPDRVDVVGAVLRVVVLDHEARAADRVVMAATGLQRAGPRERDRGEARVRDPLPVRGGDVVPGPTEVVPDKALQAFLLGWCQVVVADPGRDARELGAHAVPAQDVGRRHGIDDRDRPLLD